MEQVRGTGTRRDPDEETEGARRQCELRGLSSTLQGPPQTLPLRVLERRAHFLLRLSDTEPRVQSVCLDQRERGAGSCPPSLAFTVWGPSVGPSETTTLLNWRYWLVGKSKMGRVFPGPRTLKHTDTSL